MADRFARLRRDGYGALADELGDLWREVEKLRGLSPEQMGGQRQQVVIVQQRAESAQAAAEVADTKAVEAQGTATIADVKADSAQTAADAARTAAITADEKAQEALDRPAGGTTITTSLDDPTLLEPVPTAPDGAIWWQVNADDNLVAQWRMSDGAWVPQSFESSLIAEELVGKRIVGGEIEGGTIRGTVSLDSGGTLSVGGGSQPGLITVLGNNGRRANLSSGILSLQPGVVQGADASRGIAYVAAWKTSLGDGRITSELVLSMTQDDGTQLQVVFGGFEPNGGPHRAIRARGSSQFDSLVVGPYSSAEAGEFRVRAGVPIILPDAAIQPAALASGIDAAKLSGTIAAERMPAPTEIPASAMFTAVSGFSIMSGGGRRDGQTIKFAGRAQKASGNIAHGEMVARLGAAFRNGALADEPLGGIVSGGVSGMSGTILRGPAHATPGAINAIQPPSGNNIIEFAGIIILPAGS